jgi:hypothetical protein
MIGVREGAAATHHARRLALLAAGRVWTIPGGRKKLESGKMPENGDESHLLTAR